MHVYIVERNYAHEPGKIEGVYESSGDAEEFAREEAETEMERWGKKTMDSWRDASEGHVVTFKVDDVTIVVSGHDVQ